MSETPLNGRSPSSSLPQSLETARAWYTDALTLAADRHGRNGYNEALALLGRTDLYFLLRHLLSRADIEHPWLFARCREVQASPNGHLDLWSREHYKSSIITFGKTVQDVLVDPELTVGLFSHTNKIAKGFLRQIKTEFETNERLKAVYPDVLWEEPRKQAQKWTEDEGIVVKRNGNPKELTIEAYGLVDGQPTSRHFKLMVYDDVVTRESVTTPDMIASVTSAWELSRNLASEGGHTRYIGTRYHFNDTYREILNRKAAKPRIYPATVDGTVDGEPVLMSRETIATKRREMGPYTFGAQMLQDPTADSTQGFKSEWLREHEGSERGLNLYILADPASAKKRASDFTSMMVVGLGQDENMYIVDMLRDRLGLVERADALFALHRRWRPIAVGYEKYGMMADIEHIEDRQRRENYRFDITPLGGLMPKPDRIRRLIPYFESGRVYLPPLLYKTNYQGQHVNLTEAFVEEEYKAFPVGVHDDMLDALSRICDPDMNIIWPKYSEQSDRYARRRQTRPRGTFMSA